MKNPIITTFKTFICLCLLLTLDRAQAASLLLDFGPTVAVDPDTTNSPAHWTTGIPLNEKTWSQITGDTSNRLIYSDGTTATGVSVDVGNSIDNGTMEINSPAKAEWWNPPTADHNNSATFSFVDGHAKMWKWHGDLIKQNQRYNADDTLAQRGSATSNPMSGISVAATDPDFLKLVGALPPP